MPAHIDHDTLLKQVLVIATIAGGTELVAVEIPGGKASANFLCLCFTIPRKIIVPHEALKEV